MPVPESIRVLHRSQPLHRLPGVRAGVRECDTHKGQSMIQLDYVEPGRSRRRRCRWSACTAIRRPVPRSVRPMRSRRTEDGVVQSARKPRCIACNNCVLACPFGVPKMKTELAADDEVRHVLRPHLGRQEADVRDGLSERGAALRHAGGDRALRPRSTPINEFRFGGTDHHHEGEHDGAEGQPVTHIDVTSAMDEGPVGRERPMNLLDDIFEGD